MAAVRYDSFADFYPYYLAQHDHRICRRAHFIGTTLALACLVQAIVRTNAWWLAAALVCGYGGAWIGHVFYEKNRPATFDYAWYAFRADWIMVWQMLTGKLSW